MTEGEKCGLNSIIPVSCRGRAEAFARRLHSRLSSLGSQDDNSSADENSWLAVNDNPIAISQPRHVTDTTNMYLDFGLLESPVSPEEEEVEETEIDKLISGDILKNSHKDECHCPKRKLFRSSSNDSDSDGPFYDSENFPCCNRDVQLDSCEGIENETEINQEESFASTSDCTPHQVSEDTSSNIEGDETCVSLTDVSAFTETNCTDEYSKCNGEITPLPKDVDTFFSHLSVDKDLMVECSNNKKLTVEIIVNQNGADFTDDDVEVEERIPRVRRCSSLKTGKTPPGTPGRKKIVRFADALGLDLADVRTFLDEIPKVPTSAYEDLSVDLSDSISDSNLSKFNGIRVDKIIMPLFQQPGGMPNFLDLVREYQVCLENAVVDDPVMLSVKGTVRVRNLDFHKSLHIRYSLNSWATFADVQATYVENSCDGFSDKFSFILYAHTLVVGQRLEFACRFQCKGCQYWDNNKGANYCFQCLPATNSTPCAPITQVDDWGGASFY